MISVIIPIYNVFPYLPQCIDSVLSQTYEDLEVILVDDGSVDGCSDLCDEYVQKDRRINVMHKENGGLSDARNVGLSVAKGEWVYFVDSDDWLDTNAIEKMYDYAITNHCDVVQGNMYYVYKDYMLYRKATKKERKKNLLKRDEAMRELIINDRVKNFAWGKLYKKEMMQDLLFPVGKFFEDSYWQHLVIDRVSCYGIIDEPLYYYRQREDSISGIRSDRLNDLLEGYENRMNFIQKKYPELLSLMRKKYNRLKEQIIPSCSAVSYIKQFIQRIKGRLTTSKYQKLYI